MLTVSELEKHFTSHILDGKRIDGFSGISFAVAEGEAVGLEGPSGIGKSSVLKCIYRTYLASAGSVRYRSQAFGEIDLTHADEHTVLRLRSTELGYVTQFLKVLPRVTAVDVVADPLIRRGVAAQQASDLARALLQRLRIPTRLLDAYPVTFSGGEQQRVNFARGIIARPRLLLLDEPTASLDPVSQSVVVEILAELRAEGTAQVVIFHDKTLMASVTDRTYAMPIKPEPTAIRSGPRA